MGHDLLGYVEAAIQRLADDKVSSQNGSHAAGIFNKAANGFEKRVAAFTASVTQRSDLDTMTLGALIQILEKSPDAKPQPLKGIIAGAKEVNDPWKKVKHGDDPPVGELLHGLRKIVEVLRTLPS